MFPDFLKAPYGLALDLGTLSGVGFKVGFHSSKDCRNPKSKRLLGFFCPSLLLWGKLSAKRQFFCHLLFLALGNTWKIKVIPTFFFIVIFGVFALLVLLLSRYEGSLLDSFIHG
jgi:hypothetical protein